MAENNCPDETETKDVIDFCEYNAKDDNNENGIRITPVISVGQKATPSIRKENEPHFDTGSIYPIRVTSASESSAVGASIYTTEHNNSPSTRGHELLVVRSPEEQHDYNQQVIKKLKKENTELKRIKMCAICGIKDFEYVFQPCGHLTCDVCSELDICTCNAHVTSKHMCILSRTCSS